MPKDSDPPPARGLTKQFTFWQDREIRFDAPVAVLTLRENTEQVYATYHQIEDTKGNNGQAGTLLVTNLRLIWWSALRKRTNLSIGYYCIQNVTTQETDSKLVGGSAEALGVTAKFGNTRFQFVFTCITRRANGAGEAEKGIRSSPAGSSDENRKKLFYTVQAVWRAYEGSRVYRELRVRSAVVQDGNIITLRGEQVLSKLSGVTNVSKEQGHIGIFVVTNTRIVWYAAGTESLNVSVPYLQFTALRSQSSKFGQALVIETSSYAGNFVLGFRVDPVERLNRLYQEVGSMWKGWVAKPVLGMFVELTDSSGAAGAGSSLEGGAAAGASLGGAGSDVGVSPTSPAAPGERGMPTSTVKRKIDGQDVLEDAPEDAFAAYYADEGQKGADRRPVFDESIGLAVEKLRKGVALQALWDASPS